MVSEENIPGEDEEDTHTCCTSLSCCCCGWWFVRKLCQTKTVRSKRDDENPYWKKTETKMTASIMIFLFLIFCVF